MHFLGQKAAQISAALSLIPLLAVNAAPPAAPPKHNDFSCRSTTHPNPVVLLHGLGATYYEDLNFLQAYLSRQGYCTFSITYGDYPKFPFVGGLMPINASAPVIGAFIKTVHAKTGAAKVDVVGHSEGAFQTLYVPKFEGVAHITQTLVAIAPPTHGTTFAGLVTLISAFGTFGRSVATKILDTVGCDACTDLIVGGVAVERLNNGKPIVQPGNKLTVIASTHDELVTPTYVAFVNETGVRNLYIQDFCPFDPVGHIGEAYDLNVWNLVVNALDDTPNRKFVCSAGAPGRR